MNGRLVRDRIDDVAFYFPKSTRCVALFKLPETGNYVVVAQNEFGIAKSNGYVEVATEGTLTHHSRIVSIDVFRNSIQFPLTSPSTNRLSRSTYPDVSGRS